MSKGQKNQARMREQLLKKREHGEKFVEWKLSPEQLSFIQNEMHLTATPTIYEISAKRIPKIQQQPHVLKFVNNAFKNGRKKLYMRLAEYEVEALERANVDVRQFKYRIDLMPV